MARKMTFVIDGDVDTSITVTELDDGTLRFDIKVLGSGSIGDLRALFFDLDGFDTSVDGLSVTSTAEYDGDVTDQAYSEGGVDTLGQDANIKGQVSNELGDFDIGIEFGTSGMSENDIQETSFILSYDDGIAETDDSLSLDMLSLSDFGVRYTSVGDWSGYERTGSEKAGAVAGGVAQNDVMPDVEENATSDTFNVLTNDADLSTPQVIQFTFDGTSYGVGTSANIVVDGKTYGTMSVASDGTVTLDANGVDVDALNEGDEIALAFSYTAESTDGSQATADVAAKIVGVNDATPILAESYNTISAGAAGGTRLLSVGTDGSLAEFAFAANNGTFAYGTELGDINGDGELDLLMSGDNSDTFIYYGDGLGGFTDSGVRIDGQFQGRVGIADIDNDGDGDIFLNNNLGEAEVWRNDGTGFTKTFGYSTPTSGGYYGAQADGTFEDFNGDGYLDLHIANIDGTNPIKDVIYFGDGAGNFVDSGNDLPTGTGFNIAKFGDVNGDGYLDYVRGTSTGIEVILNDGSGNFTSSVTDFGPYFHGGIALADFDGNGTLDAVRADQDAADGISLWLNDGAGNFVYSDMIVTEGAAAENLQVGDFSGDGIADLLYNTLGGYNAGEIKTLVNDGTGNFTEADALALSGYIFETDIGLL